MLAFTNTCDLCGEEMSDEEVQETDDFTCLCSTCFEYLESLPGGNIKESIKAFLIGNVI